MKMNLLKNMMVGIAVASLCLVGCSSSPSDADEGSSNKVDKESSSKVDEDLTNKVDQEQSSDIVDNSTAEDEDSTDDADDDEEDDEDTNKCNGEKYDATQEECIDNVINRKCGTSYYVPGENLRCLDDEIIEITYGRLIDPRDGKIYKTIKIGNRTWMAENLNYETEKSMCYGTTTAECDKYGRLYAWEEATHDACPKGWHLPYKVEFDTLMIDIGGSDSAGKMLKSISGWDSGNGIDVYGFSALPAGKIHLFYTSDLGKNAYFWSSNSTGDNEAYYMTLTANLEGAYMHKSGFKYDSYSVRCVQDLNSR